eukprot:334115-Chlamydomonas_euryale.AAC.3
MALRPNAERAARAKQGAPAGSICPQSLRRQALAATHHPRPRSRVLAAASRTQHRPLGSGGQAISGGAKAIAPTPQQ